MNRQILEYTRSDKVDRIDREGGVIYGAKLLGEESQNPPPYDHTYPRSTREGAISLLEGARVCIDHPDPSSQKKTRSYGDGMGMIKGVEERGDGLYGNFHFNPKHHLAEQICWDAEHAPQHLGFSINGNGDKRREGGRTIVEGITELLSVDLVSRPATTNGLFEGQINVKRSTVKALRESLKAKRPGWARALCEAAEAGILSDDMGMDEPAPMDAPEESADHEEALKQGFKAALSAVLDDDSMDMKAKLSKLKEIMTAQEKLCNGKESKSAPPESESKAEESLQLDALKQLGRKGVKLSPLIESAVRGCKTTKDVKELVESLDGTSTSNRPRSSTPSREHVAPGSSVQESKREQQANPDESRKTRVQQLRAQR